MVPATAKMGFPLSLNQDNHHRHAQRLSFQVLLDFVKAVHMTHLWNCGWMREGESQVMGDQRTFLT